MRFKNTIQIF